MGIRLMLLAALALLVGVVSAHAEVRVLVGPTPIRAGNATAATDITVVNEQLAFALAVGSPVPYGVPRGALIDIAPVTHGEIGRDRVVFADFIPNNWSAWPNTYQHVEVLEAGPLQARIRAVRDWGKVRIETLYTLKADSDRLIISTTMTNEGDSTLTDLLSGLTLWPNSGFLFAVPGLAGLNEGPAAGALAKRVSAYDDNWTVTLHAPYLDHVGSGSRDMFLRHTLKPGESRSFEGWLQVGSSGDLAPVLAAEIEQQHVAAGRIHGRVTSRADAPLERPVVIVEKNGKPYAWVLGREGNYDLPLPVGEYSLYATGRGYSQSGSQSVTVSPGSEQILDFAQLQEPGRIEFSVKNAKTSAPLDARIAIESGNKPVVQFLGRQTFFTALSPKGRADVPIAPGDYRFTVSAGAGFLARDVEIRALVTPGHTVHSNVLITPLFDPPARGWYAADLHHHADQAEAVTPPGDLARSQLAAGLDVLFVSDHDATVNHAALLAIAQARGVPFIPGIELSPSWGHFNAYPLHAGAKLAIDTSTASISELLQEARREGATVVQVNHPFIPYGYFASLAAGVAPGGFDGRFDLVEINSANSSDDPKVLARLWQYWNEGKPYYLTAGSDTHDVWNEQSGRVRMYAHLEGRVTAANFAAALKAGHAYATYGPLIFPSVLFGTRLPVKPGQAVTLGFDLGSVAGLKEVQLIGDGTIRETRTLAADQQTIHVDFKLTGARAGWYSLLVEDQAGRKAYTNPIWIVPAGTPRAAASP
jgi:Carboxypeptidase regulatory-like domain